MFVRKQDWIYSEIKIENPPNNNTKESKIMTSKILIRKNMWCIVRRRRNIFYIYPYILSSEHNKFEDVL